MGDLDLDVSELRKLDADIRAQAQQMGPAANRAIKASTEYVHALAESSAAVLTGELRDSIKMDRSGVTKTQARRVYATDESAMANEYGTAEQPPRPFLMVHAPAGEAALEAAILEELDQLGL